MSENEDQEKMLKALDMVLMGLVNDSKERAYILEAVKTVSGRNSLGDKDADELMGIINRLGNLVAAPSMGFKKWKSGQLIPCQWVDIIMMDGVVVYGCVVVDYGRMIKRTRNSDATLCAKDDLWFRVNGVVT